MGVCKTSQDLNARMRRKDLILQAMKSLLGLWELRSDG